MFGWHQPWPYEWGGGPTEVERIWAALRTAVGKGGTAPNLDGVDGIWREAKAQALAALRTAGERAAMQAFPDRALEFLSWYETALGAPSAPDDGDFERMERVSDLWTKQVRSRAAEVEALLIAIDERFRVLSHTWDQSDTTMAGKTLQPASGSPSYGRAGTEYPQFSSRHVWFIQIGLGSGSPGETPTPIEAAAILRARDILDEALPAWETYQFLYNVGFSLDLSALDATAFGS